MIHKPVRARTIIVIFALVIVVIGVFLFNKNKTMPKIPENFEVYQFEKIHQFNKEEKEVLVGVISDTHIPTRVKRLPEDVKEIFNGVDLIIHAGDIETLEVLEELQKIATVYAVTGNWESTQVKDKLPTGIVVEIFDFRIGVVHSPNSFWLGSHFNFIQEYVAPGLAQRHNLDILIFGHTHRPLLKKTNLGEQDILLFNPGSPTTPFLSQPSVGLLRITKDSFQGKIINLDL